MEAVTRKKYQCGICGMVREVETNHTHDIYSSCRWCGFSQAKCIEPDRTPFVPKRTLCIKHYRFDMRNEEEYSEYKQLKSLIKSMYPITKVSYDTYFSTAQNRVKWDSIRDHIAGKAIPYSGLTDRGYYLCDGFHLVNWREVQYPAKYIKEGYYVTGTYPLEDEG